jgi:hypothetical protein
MPQFNLSERLFWGFSGAMSAHLIPTLHPKVKAKVKEKEGG